MRVPVYSHQFEKDLKLMKKRGKDLEKLKMLIRKVCNGEILDPRFRDHPLKGRYMNRRECHIEPDWLLIYKLEPGIVIFERLGTHSDLFE